MAVQQQQRWATAADAGVQRASRASRARNLSHRKMTETFHELVTAFCAAHCSSFKCIIEPTLLIDRKKSSAAEKMGCYAVTGTFAARTTRLTPTAVMAVPSTVKAVIGSEKSSHAINAVDGGTRYSKLVTAVAAPR